MKPWGWVAALAILWLAAVADQSLSAGGFTAVWMPHLATGVALMTALHTRPALGALAGFLAGWLMGASAGGSLVHLIFPHLVACFALSYVREIQLELNLWTASVWTAVGAFLIHASYLVLISPAGLGGALLLAPVSAILTALCCLPVYAVLSRSAAAQGP